MFNCYAHGWSSHVYTCPACTNFVTSSSSAVPDYIVGISGHELSKLKEENARLREALEFYARLGIEPGTTPTGDTPLHRDPYWQDQGKRARAALEGK